MPETEKPLTARDFQGDQLTLTLETIVRQMNPATQDVVAQWRGKLPRLSEDVRLRLAQHRQAGIRALAIAPQGSNKKIWEQLRADPSPLVRQGWLQLPQLTGAGLLELAQSARPDEIPDIVAHPRFDQKVRQALKVQGLAPWAALSETEQLACLIDPATPLKTVLLLALGDNEKLCSRAVFHPALSQAHLLSLTKVAKVHTREALSWVPNLSEAAMRAGILKDQNGRWHCRAWLKRADFPPELAHELAQT